MNIHPSWNFLKDCKDDDIAYMVDTMREEWTKREIYFSNHLQIVGKIHDFFHMSPTNQSYSSFLRKVLSSWDGKDHTNDSIDDLESMILKRKDDFENKKHDSTLIMLRVITLFFLVLLIVIKIIGVAPVSVELIKSRITSDWMWKCGLPFLLLLFAFLMFIYVQTRLGKGFINIQTTRSRYNIITNLIQLRGRYFRTRVYNRLQTYIDQYNASNVYYKESASDMTKEEIIDRFESFVKDLKAIFNDEKAEKKHDPKQTKNFLAALFQNTDARFITHVREYVEHDKALNDFKDIIDKLQEQYPNVPEHLLKNIRSFIFDKNPEWESRSDESDDPYQKEFYRTGWNENEFVAWYTEKKMHPEKSEFNDIMLQPFRQSVRVRKENGYFKGFIKRIYSEVFPNKKCLDVDESVNNVDFYTDTVELGNIIQLIFSQMQNHDKENETIRVRCEKSGEYSCILYLTQVGVKKSVNSPIDISEYGHGDTHSLLNKMKNLCNYEVEVNYSDGTYRLILLTDDESISNDKDANRKKLDYSSEGYTHILKFY